MRQEPSAWSSQWRVMVTGRIWSSVRPSARATEEMVSDTSTTYPRVLRAGQWPVPVPTRPQSTHRPTMICVPRHVPFVRTVVGFTFWVRPVSMVIVVWHENGEHVMTQFAIETRDLQLLSKRGMVYGPLDWRLEMGRLGIVSGPPDSGKLTLMLTFTGRMKPSEPSQLASAGPLVSPATPGGCSTHSSVMGVGGLDDLDDVVTVRATVRERLAWLVLPHRAQSFRRADPAAVRIGIR